MRAYLSATLMGIGGIFVSFAAVLFIIEIYGSRSDPKETVAAMTALGLETLIGGAILFVLGFLVSRVGRRDPEPIAERV
jgi:hypothetical protein